MRDVLYLCGREQIGQDGVVLLKARTFFKDQITSVKISKLTILLDL